MSFFEFTGWFLTSFLVGSMSGHYIARKAYEPIVDEAIKILKLNTTKHRNNKHYEN